MTDKKVLDILNDPVAQRLINSVIPARMAYTGADGFPRVVPMGYYWNGSAIQMGSPVNAPKVRALCERPEVALTIDTESMPPNILLIRGTATIEVVDGVADAFLQASRRRIDPAGWDEFEAGTRGMYKQMAVITITPTWVKVIDFETRLPQPIEELVRDASA